jgi:transitional endoplasmic reticulum ATPase
VTRPRTRLREITGMQEFKRRLEGAAREVLFPPRGAPAGEAGNGILLHGEPGNGKTLFATALAGDLGVPLVTVNVPGIVSRWVNQTTEQLMQACDEAVRHAPCVLFFDEFDALAVERGRIGCADSESGRTVTALLQRLDALAGTRVLVVAATNRLEAIDQALRRDGRFSVTLEVPPPDLPARVAIFRDVFSKRAPAVRVEAQLLAARAQRWEGFSAARVRAFALEAAGLVRDTGSPHLDRRMLLRAQRQVVGASGDRLGERVPRLEELVLLPALAQRLSGLARRMQAGEQLELAGGGLPRGVLFYGPPGTGKTLSAQALAKTADWACLATTSHDLLADADRIDTLFARAANLRPCVVLIDEADDVLMERGLAPWSRAITAKLLSVLDGASGPRHDILFVAATNHPDVLDAAALRGGRFAEKYAFALPDTEEIAQYLRGWQARSATALHPTLTPEAIALQLAPASFADVQAVLTAAVNSMWERGERHVSPEDFAVAGETVLGWRWRHPSRANAPGE